MKINLPNNPGKITKNASKLYAEATMKSRHSQRTAGYFGGDTQLAYPKIFDPSRPNAMGGYGSMGNGLNLLDFDENEETRKRLLLACRNIAKTHPVFRACVEVYSRYPIRGLKLEHEDKEYERFYRELFLEDLDFKNFMIDLGKVYWVDGNAFVYGNWSEKLGLWVGEDILDPTCMEIKRIPFVGEDLIYMKPQQELRDIVERSEPAALAFRNQFPEMYAAIHRGDDILINQDRLTFIANKDRPTDLWGTPVMFRAWNTLRLEDRMNAAMQATADRLYAPLVMFTIGGLLPDGSQFIPSAAMLDAFRENLDAALAADFRAIITHSGVDAKEVIRGERINNFKPDVDMFDERIFMAWGLSSSILKPQTNTYASAALEFQLAAQMLASYQDTLVEVYNKQAAFVAEAHEHYEYEQKGDQKKIVFEKKEIWDPEAGDGEGAWVVRDVPKLSFPKMKFDVINFNDEKTERDFRLALKKEGLPISDEDLAIGVDIDLKASAKKYNEEQIEKKMAEAKREQAVFQSTVEQGYVVPPDTKKYMELGIVPKKYADLIEKYKDDDEGVGENPFGKESDDEKLEGDLEEEFGLDDMGELDLSGDSGTFSGDTGLRVRPEISDSQRGDMPKQ